jgi:hypothetical protein
LFGLGDGIDIRESSGNHVGGASPGDKNVISANTNVAVRIFTPNTRENIVMGNYLGTDSTGFHSLPNGDYGVYIYDGAACNQIGGDVAESGNLISGNGLSGLVISGPGSDSNWVAFNHIGLNASGMLPLGNTEQGLCLFNQAQFNRIGPNNIISGNGGYGVLIHGIGTDSNTVTANWIGLNVTGQDSLSNTWHGMRIDNNAQYNIIGGPLPVDGNIISGNRWSGIRISGRETSYNIFENNLLGCNIDGTAACGNRDSGISMSSSHNLFRNNIISGNHGSGIYISNYSQNNQFSRNKIGVQADSFTPLPNEQDGIHYDYETEAANDSIGPDNLIAHNSEYGIRLMDSTSNSIIMTQNSIFSNGMQGILLMGGANDSIASPIILGEDPLSGTAPPFARIEIFSDSSGQGRFFEGVILTDSIGQWTWSNAVQGPNITAVSIDTMGNTSMFSSPFVCNQTQSMMTSQFNQAPNEFQLYQNYPNPFNPVTTIRFDVKSPEKVLLKVHNILGQEVATLLDARCLPGSFEIPFDGSRLSSGIYFFKIQIGAYKSIKKMILVE